MRFIAKRADLKITKGRGYRGKFVSAIRENGPAVKILVYGDDGRRRSYDPKCFRISDESRVRRDPFVFLSYEDSYT